MPRRRDPAVKTWQIRFNMPDDLRWRFRVAADRRRLNVQDALTSAVVDWINNTPPVGRRTQP